MRLVIKNLPLKHTEEDVKKVFEEYGKITDLYLCKNIKNRSKGVCFLGFSDEESAMKAVKYRHRSYLNNKKITVDLLGNTKEKQLRLEFKKLTDREDEKNEEENIEIKSKSLYIKNIPKIAEKSDVYEHFDNCNIKSIKFLQDENEKIPHKHALLIMEDFDSAKNAILYKEPFMGCRLNISFYNEPIAQKKYFKQLFFNFEAVVDSICQEEKITRAELLDLKDKNLGTRISLIETHLVEQTKMFLEQNDIFLDNITGKLDKKTLIVRNSNLLSLDFKNCEIKIAPSKTLAILKFNSSEEAQKVYKELHLKRVNDKAIYVDYLPVSFADKKKIKTTNKLIIKNVPFQADKNDLKRLFSTKTKIQTLRLPKKADGTHKGYCFLTVNTADEAEVIIKYFGTNTHLYGRRLVIEPAET
ncbi:RNA-binding protein (RRM superfamily) [Pseudoloma neurophilia]|uniref:RNA-binding protein (RRM superfamily) n=1 Tax=Pseudoloma neurophilia TaxID=146866 RepID=A0A0R0M2L2_9MICR|nr:RNA-binding protein (RRM superfamily) [Pseudoloma neurophilia]